MHKSYFKTTLIFLILAELLSIFAWALPGFSSISFAVILLITLILALKRLSSGILVALAELIVGSHGYLFSLEIGSTLISLRLGIFMVVLLAWLIHLVRTGGFASYWQTLKTFEFSKFYLYLTLALIWGFVWGLIRHNDFGNLFLDFNNWLFFLYLLPILSAAQDQDFWSDLKAVVMAALAWLIAKTIILLYIFSHQFLWALPELYIWLRDTRIGEITMISDNFYRIFIQSQLYALLGFFILLPFIKFKLNKYLILSLFFLSVVIISFSRSFWVGLVAGLFIFYLYLVIYHRKKIIPRALLLISLAALSLAIIFLTINLPPDVSGQSLGSLISQRTTQIEAAGSSRLNMLAPLAQAIINHPIIGSGFGTTVTYRSLDPRILSTTAGASGSYTTYAFEWAYLDLLLKIGLAGLIVYLLLVYRVIKRFYESRHHKFSLGLILALVALLSLNIFTPYLNHPLGIGFIVLASVAAAKKELAIH